MADTELTQEKAYLQKVYDKLVHSEETLESAIAAYDKDGYERVREMKRDVTANYDNYADNLDSFSALEMKNREIDQLNLRMQTAAVTLKKVKKLLESPYFAKIIVDYLDGGDLEAFYIGINNYTDENKEQLVLDWRSPVAELFYNNELGHSSYRANSYDINVAISGRRQFIIEKDQFIRYFDTSIAIQDDVLLEALEQNQTLQMQDITTTIQKEQNVVIRDLAHSIVLVNGIAGSGKTSTIMQRIAYLLYSLREEITSDNVLILSPNNHFIDYIASVLPSLGERNPLNMTMIQFVSRQLNTLLEDETAYFNRISAERNDLQTATLHSLEFVDFIKNADSLLANADNLFRDIKLKGRVVISKQEIENVYAGTPVDNSLFERIQATKQLIEKSWDNHLTKQATNSKVQDQIMDLSEEGQLKYFGELITDESKESITVYAERRLRSKYKKVSAKIEDNKWVNIRSIFDQLFKFHTQTAYDHPDGPLNLDEAVIYLVIINQFVEKLRFGAMRFVLIDEVQDYTPAQISLLSDIFVKSDFTMVGDENQAIFNSLIHFDEIAGIFNQHSGQSKRYDLVNSYRSSGNITKLFGQLATSAETMTIVPVRPDGKEPKFVAIEDEKAFNNFIANISIEINGAPLTVITKTAWEADYLKTVVSEEVEVKPISLSKGLEFDNVLIFNASQTNYHTERDQRILYTAISRAMDNVFISYQDELSCFFK